MKKNKVILFENDKTGDVGVFTGGSERKCLVKINLLVTQPVENGEEERICCIRR